MRTTVGTIDPLVKQAMDTVELDPDTQSVLAANWYEAEGFTGQEMERKSRELYEVLCMICSGMRC